MMQFRVIKTAISNLLGAQAAGRYTVEGYQRQSHSAEEILGNLRHVTVYYVSGAFPEGESALEQGPYDHEMTFRVELLLSAAATADLTALGDQNATAAQYAAALAASLPASANADSLFDELVDIVWTILIDTPNRDLGLPQYTIEKRWIRNIQKEHPLPRGEYMVLAGTMDYVCRSVERTPALGVQLVPAGAHALDASIGETADITGATQDPALQGVKTSP
jgi:hypothetical protein